MKINPDESPVYTLTAPYFEHLHRLTSELNQQPWKVVMLESESYSQFACTQCGECCKTPWSIHVTKDYYEHWYPILDAHPSGRFKQPFNLVSEPGEHVYGDVRRKPGTSECIFLEPDQTCFIHATYGAEALSPVCRKYPRLIKDMGNLYASRQLLHSCQAVPDFNRRFPGTLYRILDLYALGFAANMQPVPDYPNRQANYLWLGMAMDLLDAPQPATSLSRWQLMLPTIEWMEGIGFEKLTPSEMQHLYRDLMNRAANQGLEVPASEKLSQALNWSRSMFSDHPGCFQWLRALEQKLEPWPRLSPEERQMLDEQIYHYLRGRLFSLPYQDLMGAGLSFWQQQLLLGIQILMLQWLALFSRRQSQGSLQLEHLQRAVNAVGLRYEQRNKIAEEFRFHQLSSQACYKALDSLLSLDFASAWIGL